MTTTLRPTTALELSDLLRSNRSPLRLCGSGSRQERLAEPATAVRVDLRGLDTIHQLDAPDLTCSIGAGVDRAALDGELHARGVELPCAGSGTIGGLFASDPIGAVTNGGAAPRTLLLGLEAVLANGTPWKSGARVVKSVAGFDVHKLLVGSNGRLFAATRLHLRLAPRPRAEAWFRRNGLDEDAALVLFATLRGLAVPPRALHLRRERGGCTVAGRIAGRPNHVATTLRLHELPESGPFAALHVEPAADGEVVAGIVLPSRVPALLAVAPADAPFVLHGGGRFEIALPSPAASDALLASAPAVPAQACVVRGAPLRRGRGTPIDAGQQRIVSGIKKALDPDGILV